MKKLFTIITIGCLLTGSLFAATTLTKKNLEVNLNVKQIEIAPEFKLIYGNTSTLATEGSATALNVTTRNGNPLNFSNNTRTERFTITLANDINLSSANTYTISISPTFFSGTIANNTVTLTDLPISVISPTVGQVSPSDFTFVPTSSGVLGSIARSYPIGLTEASSTNATFGLFYLDWDANNAIVAGSYSSTVTIAITQA
ncbi:MAG: hypothetical protein JJE21_09265 [Spirochaetaceae bacterium]|nr:hypothetical protein [Spirochaetaceae bacterium]